MFAEKAVAREVEAHLKGAAGRGREAMGLLLGDRFGDGREGVFSVALSSVTAPLEATSSHVRFDAARFEALAAALERQPYDFVIVGWYHSHLDLGCFMSSTDLETQRRYFAAPHQVSWVLDPVREESEGFRIERGAALPAMVRQFDARAPGAIDYRLPKAPPSQSRKRGAYTPR